jgi:hypothetical protein
MGDAPAVIGGEQGGADGKSCRAFWPLFAEIWSRVLCSGPVAQPSLRAVNPVGLAADLDDVGVERHPVHDRAAELLVGEL